MRTYRKITGKQRQKLFAALVGGQNDFVAVGEQFGMTLDDISHFMSQPENATVLAKLCRAADAHTQVTVNRYRLLAATKLIEIAMNRDGNTRDDVSRRACLDLLKLELNSDQMPTDDSDWSDEEADAAFAQAIKGLGSAGVGE